MHKLHINYECTFLLAVTLHAKPGQSFRGFILHASRVSGDTEELIGDFTLPSPDAKALQWYPQNKNVKVWQIELTELYPCFFLCNISIWLITNFKVVFSFRIYN